jgi:hypothetical protein
VEFDPAGADELERDGVDGVDGVEGAGADVAGEPEMVGAVALLS